MHMVPCQPSEGGGGGGRLFEPGTFNLRYFEKFSLFIDSLLVRLQNDVEIMGYICKCSFWGGERVMTLFNMVHVITSLTFPL